MKPVHVCLQMLSCLFLGHGPAAADGIVGKWITEDGKYMIGVYKFGDRYCGKVLWVQPAPTGHDKRVVGSMVAGNMRYETENKWSGGWLYDPGKGKYYRGSLTLPNPNRLVVRGYSGIPLLGRTYALFRLQH